MLHDVRPSDFKNWESLIQVLPSANMDQSTFPLSTHFIEPKLGLAIVSEKPFQNAYAVCYSQLFI